MFYPEQTKYLIAEDPGSGLENILICRPPGTMTLFWPFNEKKGNATGGKPAGGANMDQSLRRRWRSFMYRDFAPATKVVLGLELAAFLFSALSGIEHLMGLDVQRALVRPWSFLTYSLLNGSVLSVLFGGLWWWFIGSSMERTWGTRRFVMNWLIITAVTGASLWLGASLRGIPLFVAGWYLPMTGLTVAWGVTYANHEVSLYGIIPIKGQWLAWLGLAVTFFSYVAVDLVLGVFSLASGAAGYLLTGSGRGPRRWLFRLRSWQGRRANRRLRRVK